MLATISGASENGVAAQHVAQRRASCCNWRPGSASDRASGCPRACSSGYPHRAALRHIPERSCKACIGSPRSGSVPRALSPGSSRPVKALKNSSARINVRESTSQPSLRDGGPGHAVVGGIRMDDARIAREAGAAQRRPHGAVIARHLCLQPAHALRSLNHVRRTEQDINQVLHLARAAR